MATTYTLSTTFSFLQKIKKNNNREWFAEHKHQYDAAYREAIAFADALLQELSKKDHIETASGKKSLYRIYNDVRFSKDKSPYKYHIGGGFKRATKLLRGGYYFHLEPGNSFVAGGFWGPNPADLLHIREQISADPAPLISILKQAEFKKTFGNLIGEQVKTAPKGFHINDPAIALIRYKQFTLRHDFSDAEVKAPDFHLNAAKIFAKMRPFLDYMSEILTTDLNGLPLS